MIYTHIKSGKDYVVITPAKMERDGSNVIVYKRGRNVWVRPREEFYKKFRPKTMGDQE